MPVKTKSGSWGSVEVVESVRKKTRQGRSARTILAATARNGANKKYRGQGR